jgi:histone H3/H4
VKWKPGVKPLLSKRNLCRCLTGSDFKNHQLPLARIKKIMKSDEDVRMISSEAPVLFAKACEMFILELTLRSWIHSEENKRRTLQRNDIAAAITKTDIFDFLVGPLHTLTPPDPQLKGASGSQPFQPLHL